MHIIVQENIPEEADKKLLLIDDLNTESMVEQQENEELIKELKSPVSNSIPQSHLYFHETQTESIASPSKLDFKGLYSNDNVVFSFAEKLKYKITKESSDSRLNLSSCKESIKIKVDFQLKKQTFESVVIRSEKEQRIVFGSIPSSEQETKSISSSLSAIDYYVPSDFINSSSKERLFQITFESGKAYVNSLVENPNILFYLRIEQPREWHIQNNDRFLMGDMIFKTDLDEVNGKLTITRLMTKRHTSFFSTTIRISDCPFTIGRHVSCKLQIDSKLLSRVHATIIYDAIACQWLFTDGEPNKQSVNGCSVSSDRKIEVARGLEFKLNSGSINVSLEDNSLIN